MPTLYPEKDRPRGIRNNNPGNIEWTKEQENIGAIGKDATPTHVFAKYPDPETGFMALACEMFYYRREFKINTLNKYGEKRCPAVDNNGIDDYGEKLAKQLCINADQEIDLLDWMPELCKAVNENENGMFIWDKEVVNRGVLRATILEAKQNLI